MHLHTLINVVNDTIQSNGTPYDQLTPREKNTRDAMFAVTVLAPIAGAFLAANFAPGLNSSSCRCGNSSKSREASEKHDCDQERTRSFHYNKLAAAWFLSIGIFGALQYFQSGSTTRGTFVLALAHNQIEVLLICLLLKLPTSSSVSATMAYGFIMYPIALFAQSLVTVFMSVAVAGGAIDFLIVCLLFYGNQWVLAAGAFGHVFSAVSVFIDFIDNFGVIPYNLCIFLGVWTHITLTLSGILYARELHLGKDKHGGGTASRLVNARDAEGKAAGKRPRSPKQQRDEPDPERSAGCYSWNPMWHTNVRPSALIAMVVISLVGSTLITLALVYWVPLWGAKHSSPPAVLSWIWHALGGSASPGRYYVQ
ncbi:hypothetical protein AURDEDRAFT_182605 [Auricularia subglabra TFB-10046 SS5]|nr:hypothetical protein AURDEDRAFT_182605 [Auricularia subglabra TFB-10046 SS5]